MGKKSKSQSKSDSQAPPGGTSILGGSGALDPTLSSLFAKSAGPVKTPVVQYDTNWSARRSTKQAKDVEDESAKSDEEFAESDEVMDDASDASESDAEEEKAPEPQGRKRKRGNAGDDLEESYMRRIEKEERKADEKKKAEQAERQKAIAKDDDSDASGSEEEKSDAEDSEDDSKSAPIPVHESLSGGDKANDVEKSSRTVFLGNVSTQAIKSKSSKKTLLRHLASFCSSLPESSGPHKVESIRFRSVPFSSGGGIPKRASFARREILDETTPSTNAYAVYSTVQAARKAPSALNGTVVLDRHLRVDSIAHPAAIDNKRCVFVGNLDFVDNESTGEDESGRKKKVRAPADIEEGLWRTFNANTGGSKDKNSTKKNVESVRVIRDQSTRVGKGFAYVQFYDENSVEAALLLNEKKFPPLLPRKIRVTRARKMAKKRDDSGSKDTRGGVEQKTLQGRAGKLLGRAGAAKVKAGGKGSIAGNSLVFEGHRATEDGSSQFKVKTKSRGSKGKPKGRSSKRAAAYRAAGGQRP